LVALGVFAGSVAGMSQQMSWNSDPAAIAEYEAYKSAYRQPPPDGLDPCEKAKWQLAREEALLVDRIAWDAQWGPGTHAQAIQESENAVRNAQKRVEKACKCQSQK
ncbi:hypothetical protein WHL36_14465, partial [Staphylococcus aureus]|uniref:hypothetical protein n=1 Tax=Staphylococcus aureus TaxID=1280 RepID=UPI0039BDD88F